MCMGTQMEHGKTWKPKRGALTGAGRDEGLKVGFPFLIHVRETGLRTHTGFLGFVFVNLLEDSWKAREG